MALFPIARYLKPCATLLWEEDAEAFLVEFAATFVFHFVFMFVLFIVDDIEFATDNRAVKDMVAVGLGAAVTINSLALMKSTSSSMVTARTLGLALLLYLVAAPLGAIAGCRAYHKYLNYITNFYVQRIARTRLSPQS
ncbi:unnamed protein product [Urochloa humidicola]